MIGSLGDVRRTTPPASCTRAPPLRVCFFNKRVELSVDGELQKQPRTRWSTTDWLADTYRDERGTKHLGLEPLGES
jgi:hypothetical protein